MKTCMPHSYSPLLSAQSHLNSLLKAEGIRTHLPLDSAFSRLNQLASSARESAERSLTILNDSLKAAKENHRNLHDTHFLLDFTCHQLGIHTSDDFTSTIEHDDLVEGYDMQSRQIFRNFQFMEICGYDLLDLLTYDWVTLYERSQTISNEILKRCEIVARTGQTLSLLDLPTHYMKERMSSTRQISRVNFRYLGPLFSQPGVPFGVTISCKAEIIDEDPVRHELRFI